MTQAPPKRVDQLRYHPVQSRLRKSNARFKVVEAGRRSGKTEHAKRDGIQRAICAHMDPGIDDYRVAFCAPTRDQAKQIYWDDLKRMTPPEFVVSISETELSIHLVNGAMIAVVGLDKPARIEGRPWDDIKWDEVADCKPGTWDRHLRPALDTDGRPGSAWIYGVPRPSSEFKRLADLGKDENEPDYEYFTWKSADILAPKVIAAAKRTMDPLMFAQEYEASRVNLQGLAYYQFNRERNLRELQPDTRAPLIFCFDFNVQPGVSAVAQEFDSRELGKPPDGCQWASDSVTGWVGEAYIPRHSNTHRVCNALIESWGDHEGLVYGYGDATGGGRSTVQGKEQWGSDWAIINDLMGRHFGDRWRDYHRRSNPRERARVNAVNARMCSADNTVGTVIDPTRAPRLIEDLELTMILEGSAGELDKKSDPAATHLTDGAGYYIEQEFPAVSRDIDSEPFN